MFFLTLLKNQNVQSF